MQNHDFCNVALKTIKDIAKRHLTLEEIGAVYSSCDSNRITYFLGPRKFRWHGKACCASFGTAIGWMLFLRKIGIADPKNLWMPYIKNIPEVGNAKL